MVSRIVIRENLRQPILVPKTQPIDKLFETMPLDESLIARFTASQTLNKGEGEADERLMISN
ncbi:MAG: Unknown protein [uncultured Thiotrichaceae bacterium]|uniref:Uncharacterized protein n=1 Tax=uncultured Thiotrichaceae bacterium TaxID=298394 RepID=A0A6S6UHA1_9GAMM|nr:MAG: Unknown protein [uncultured Thiotrichaceae bacterium]